MQESDLTVVNLLLGWMPLAVKRLRSWSSSC